MKETLRKNFGKVFVQVLLYFFVILALFLRFRSRPEPITDFIVDGNYAYVGLGEHGVEILDISASESPKKVGGFDTLGRVHGLAIHGNKLYVADGNGDVLLFDVTNPANPRFSSSISLTSSVDEVNISEDGRYLFLAGKEFGLKMFDADKLSLIHQFEEPQSAGDINILNGYLYISGDDQYLYRYEIGEPAKMVTTKLSLNANAPIQGFTIYEDGIWIATQQGVTLFVGEDDFSRIDYGLDGIASQLAVDGVNAYVVMGEQGLKIFDISDILEWKLVAEYKHLQNVSNIVQRGNLLYLSDGIVGLKVLRFEQVDQNGEIRQLALYQTPGEATIWRVFGTFLGLFRDLLFLILFRMLGISPGYSVIDLWQRIPISVWKKVGILSFGILVYGLVMLIGLYLISNFILPVYTSSKKRKIFKQLLSYLRGQHGFVTFVKNGMEKSREGDFLGGKRGIVIAGLNSAAVLEKNGSARSVGPGIHITNPGEKVRGTVDLRRQIRTRPAVSAQTRDGIEVSCLVFTLFTLGEEPDVVKVAYDGEHVAENLRVLSLEEEWRSKGGGDQNAYPVMTVGGFQDVLNPDEKEEIHRFVQAHRQVEFGTSHQSAKKRHHPGAPYSFNSERVFQSIAYQPYDIEDEVIKSWAELPVFVAVDVFRKLLAQEVYDNLYNLANRNSGEYNLAQLKNNFRVRMRHLGILAFQYVEKKDRVSLREGDLWDENLFRVFPVRELQTPTVLRRRGIKVIAAGFSELKPKDREVRSNYLFDYWRASWQRKAALIQSDLELQAMRIRNDARIQAQRDVAFTLSKILETTQYSEEAVALRLFQALESVANDSITRDLLPRDVISLMQNVKSILLDEN